MMAALLVVGFACLIRQADRLWYGGFPPWRRAASLELTNIVAWQRARANNVTPTLLLAGHWLELLAWCALLVPHGPAANTALVAIAALKFRHLQEVTHFAVHGVLARSRRWGDLLAEVFFQGPAVMSRVEQRRRVHVREHHPNATVEQVDPNLKTLAMAGIHVGSSRARAFLGLIFPVTPRGLSASSRELVSNSRNHVHIVLVLAACGAFYAAAGWRGLIFGFVVPRLTAYPLLAWMSLLVEHRWLDASVRTGKPREVEAGRCHRLYRRQPLWRTIARATWLPYGDAFHYAHSVHPAIRWNYLPALDRILVAEVAERRSVLIGRDSVLRTLYREAVNGA